MQVASALAEIGPISFGLWCAENGVINQFSTIWRIEAADEANGWLVAEICVYVIGGVWDKVFFNTVSISTFF